MPFIRFVNKLNKGLEWGVGLAIGIMTIVVFIQVMVRFVLTNFGVQLSVPWTEEIARYLMIWVVFIGGAIATRKAKLIAIESLVHALPEFWGKVLKTAAHLVSISFYIFMFMIGLEWASFGLTENTPVTRVSMVYVYVSLSVGTAIMVLNTITILVEAFIMKKDIREVTDDEIENIINEDQKVMKGA